MAVSESNDQASATPGELVPARMINEVLYCERLMYLEWGQGEFEDNAFTVEGRHVHRRNEAPTGDLPQPAEGEPQEPGDAEGNGNEDRPYKARSLWLSSERLGISAKIDVVEAEAGKVVPVEFKRGSQPDKIEGAWLPERAQVCAQVLLLRDHGYTCEYGEIYYAADRVRAAITIDQELIDTTLRAAARARELLARGELPPPLVDSPKCHGCSLVSICLPDEVALLKARQHDDGARVRRLFPARPDALPVYVQEHGAYVGKKDDRLEVRGRNGQVLADTPFLKVSNVSVFANAQVSPAVLRELASRSVPVCYFSSGGYFYALTHGLPSRNVELRQRQFELARDAQRSLALARRFIEGKVRNQRTLLRRNSRGDVRDALRDLRHSARNCLAAADAPSLLGVEGNAARIYFQSFSSMIAEERRKHTGAFDFQSRNRRPPRDPVNAMLSFAYALLVKDLTVTLFAVGFDPHLGFYHTAHHGRPALALDLAEEFRPIVADSVVLSLINNGEVMTRDFIQRAGSCAMSPGGRKAVLRAYERRMDTLVTHPIFGYTISYRRILEVQARLLGRTLFGEIPEYPSFRTR